MGTAFRQRSRVVVWLSSASASSAAASGATAAPAARADADLVGAPPPGAKAIMEGAVEDPFYTWQRHRRRVPTFVVDLVEGVEEGEATVGMALPSGILRGRSAAE